MCEDGTLSVDMVVDDLRQFVRERGWSRFHDVKNLSMLLASESGELVALLRWVSNEQSDEQARGRLRESLEAELGDIGIAWLLLCERIGVDPLACVHRKLAKNRANYPAELSHGTPERPEAQ